MLKATFLAIPAIMTMPLASLAGTYDALCNTNQKCVVKILDDRLIAGDKIVPIQAIASWSKSGPGRTTNATTGAILTILFHNYVTSNNSAFYLKQYQASFAINYYTPEQKQEMLSIAFLNESVSKWFETEIQATTGLPQKSLNDKAPQFKWSTTEYPAPKSTINNP